LSDPNTITIVVPNVLPWLSVHWEDIITILTSISVIASVIVKMFPTLSANSWLLPVIKFISRFVALNRTVDDAAIRKEIPK